MKRSADVHKSDVSGERAGVAASAAVVAVELAVSDVSKRFRAARLSPRLWIDVLGRSRIPATGPDRCCNWDRRSGSGQLSTF